MFELPLDHFVAILCSFLLLLATTCLFVKWFKICNALPPGPRPLPLVGNMMQLIGRDYRDVCKEYRKKYGEIFTVHFFNKPMIVVNGFETIKEVFLERGNLFSERHSFDVLDEVFGGKGIVQSGGGIWKRNRRFAVRTLRDFGMGKKKLETQIQREIEYFLDAVENEKGQPFDIKNLITASVSNVMCLLLFGQRYSYTDEDFIKRLDIMADLFAFDFLLKPKWTQYIPGDPFHMRKMLGQLNHLSDFYRRKIREHYEDYDETNPRDLIDAYIRQSKTEEVTPDNTSPLNDEEMVRILHDLSAAGSETTSTVIRFGIVCMLRNPEIQEKIFSEITENVPDNRPPNTDDMKNLPYTQVTVLEILRRSNIGPFAIAHRTKTDIKYRGYTIPRSAFVFPNMETVLHDSTVWEEPLEFSPERFQNISPTKENIPFGLGPRMCAGENMARMELNLFFSAMLQRFRLCPPEGEDPPSFATKLGTTASPFPFTMKAVKRM